MSDSPLESLRDPYQFLTEEGQVDAIREKIATDLCADWLWSTVTAQLRIGVFHVTGVAGWAGIKKSKAITPNGGEREPMFSQSRTCKGWKVGGVCLFDFETPCIELIADRWDLNVCSVLQRPGDPGLSSEEKQEEICRTYDPGFAPTPHRPVVFVHFKSRDTLPGPWEYWRCTRPPIDDCVPFLECWHKGPMPLAAATLIHVLGMSAERKEEQWRTLSVEDALKFNVD